MNGYYSKMIKRISLFLFIFLVTVMTPDLLGWGFFAHKEITKQAVTYLPQDIAVFYQKNHVELINRSIEPDQNRYSDKTEFPRHFIDLEKFDVSDFKSELMPDTDFKAKYGSALMLEGGYVPYAIKDYMDSLTSAIQVNDNRKMVKFSAYLAHYIEDLHVPLHTTIWYDGVGIGKGIHSRFESNLAERVIKFSDSDTYQTHYVANRDSVIFSALKQSHASYQTILTADSTIQYRMGIERSKSKSRFNDIYYTNLNNFVGSIVKTQADDAAKMVADFWLTCWLDAKKK